MHVLRTQQGKDKRGLYQMHERAGCRGEMPVHVSSLQRVGANVCADQDSRAHKAFSSEPGQDIPSAMQHVSQEFYGCSEFP